MPRALIALLATCSVLAAATAAAAEEGGGQILAGNVDAEGLPQPGYLQWLQGIAADGSGVQISVVDSGVDEQHPDLQPQMAGKIDYTGAGEEGTDDAGHGTHVAGIVAGAGVTADPFSDDNGLAYGLGVAPGAKMLDQNAVSFLAGGTSASPLVLAEEIPRIALDAVRAGSVAWNASWTTGEGQGVGYLESARMVDVAARDADPGKPGPQPLIMVFAAGNSGDGEMTLTTPNEAKNTIVVGASKMPRAGSPDELAGFSSRGPAIDGRLLPTVVAPGQGVVSTRSLAGPLCGPGAPPDPPPAVPSPLHSSCSGTSMAAPHVAGAVALIVHWWRAFNGGATPSPAMTKALLVNTAIDMAERDVPNIHEGWGRVNTGSLLRPGAQRAYVDQSVVLGDDGAARTLRVQPVDPSQPLRATLVWTDAPAAAKEPHDDTPALVNDLDLRVSSPADTFVGNRFEGGASVAGGAPDRLNNVENVWLPSPGGAPVDVTVSAVALRGDGVPGDDDATDQDYALVVSNARLVPQPAAAPARKPRVSVRFRGRRIRSLVVRHVPARATVKVTCVGRCPRRGVRRRFTKATPRADLTRLVRTWRPARVTVTVAGAGPPVRKTVRAPRRSAAR